MSGMFTVVYSVARDRCPIIRPKAQPGSQIKTKSQDSTSEHTHPLCILHSWQLAKEQLLFVPGRCFLAGDFCLRYMAMGCDGLMAPHRAQFTDTAKNADVNHPRLWKKGRVCCALKLQIRTFPGTNMEVDGRVN